MWSQHSEMGGDARPHPYGEAAVTRERMSKYLAVAFFFRFAVGSAAAETFIGFTASVASNDDIYSRDGWPNLTLFGNNMWIWMNSIACG